jgi:murein L,D-transpeptidase YcbB/YkuD
MRLGQVLLLPFVVLALLACGCGTGEGERQIASAVEQAVAGRPIARSTAAAWKDVREFYKQRTNKPAWVNHKSTSDESEEALAVLRSAVEHGLNPEHYDASGIAELHGAVESLDDKAPDRLPRLAQFEARVTAALLLLGRDVALGYTKPAAVVGHWKSGREAPDLVGTLARAVDEESLAEWLDEVRPRHAEYAALQKAHGDLLGQKQKGGWPAVRGGTLRPGKSHPSIVALRQRLAASGQLKADAATNNSPVYDSSIEAAVKAFQEQHGIKASGVVDGQTLAALNVPIDERLRQVAMNLDRWRWMPDDLGARHFLVNIPSFHLIAREHGKPVMDIRVVVGKRGTETPVFSDEMEVVVFSPYWNIPDSIKEGELAPAVLRNPDYLARNNMEILRGSRRISPESVNWSDPNELRQLAIRQRPGPTNALGHVKFLFPNEFDVYLHDTPADSLFERQGRAFSHGCIRVEEPEKLARYVLRDDPEWDHPRILQAMHSGRERQVKLNEKIPVHVGYFTTWVDENGGLHFRPDLYGYDARQRSGIS